MAGLNLDQILDAVCDLKPGEETVEAQRGHYGTILTEMCSKLRNQIRCRDDRFEFVPKETSQYDDLVYEAAERLKKDPELFRRMLDRLVAYVDPNDPKGSCPFGPFLPAEDWQRVSLTVKSWHGQERTGKVTIGDLEKTQLTNVEVEGEDDFLVVLARRTMTEKDVDKLLRKGAKAVDPRVVSWAPAEMSDAERTTMATVAAHLLVADEHRDSPFAKTAEREFRKDGLRAFEAIVGMYARGVAKTSRTSMDVSTVGGVEGALTRMASAAMETCYQAREIDFGSRKFDGAAAVKLINGLVKLDQSVSEGDQLWSAVENFAAPLGLVRPEAPKRLDPEGCKFFKRIRDKILELGQTGLEVRTVYNWFTGYRAEDGAESAGLKANELILNPDTVKTRLEPRLEDLEKCYVSAYLDALTELDRIQGELEKAAANAESAEELGALKDFANELAEAEKRVERFNGELAGLPKRLRPSPEDRDKAEIEVKQEAMVKPVDLAFGTADWIGGKPCAQTCAGARGDFSAG